MPLLCQSPCPPSTALQRGLPRPYRKRAGLVNVLVGDGGGMGWGELEDALSNTAHCVMGTDEINLIWNFRFGLSSLFATSRRGLNNVWNRWKFRDYLIVTFPAILGLCETELGN